MPLRLVHLAAAVTVGWDKLVVAMAALAGSTVLTITGHVTAEATIGIYMTVIGYVLGRASSIADAQAAAANGGGTT